MARELLPYNYLSLSLDHEFFDCYDFWDRLSFVSEGIAPNHMREALYQADIAFVKAVIAGNLESAYAALCSRYEATGRTIENGQSFTGDEIGPATLGQCLEFADFWQIDDPRLPLMRKDYEMLSFIHAYENPWPGEEEAIAFFDNSGQLLLFDDQNYQ